MKKKICLVEDTPDLLSNFTELLLMEGFDVLACANSEIALCRLENEVPDLIITDLLMPGIGGLELIEAVRSDMRLQHVPIAIFSAKPFSEYEERAKRSGVYSYIKKPAGLEDIVKTVNGLLKT